MKKINLFISFTLLICFIIPYSVYAVDDPGFFNDCEYILSKGYATQNNSSHSNTANKNHFQYITEEDTYNLYTPNAYIIGNSNYRAMDLRDVYFDKDYGGSLQFEFYNHDLYAWGPRETDIFGVSQGTAWQTNGKYEGYLILGSLKGTKFEFPQYRTGSAVAGILAKEYDYKTAPWEMGNTDINHHSFYTKNDGMTISVLHFATKITGNNRQNKIVFNIINNQFLTEDVYVLGFAIKPYVSIDDSISSTNLTDVSLDTFNDFRKKFQSTCYVGDLPIDMTDLNVIECDGAIDCAIKKVSSTLENWVHGLLDFLSSLFVPNGERFSNMATDFMDWFDLKLGFLAQPLTFTIDFLNRFLNLEDTGHYLIKVPDIKVPLFDYTIIHGFNYDLASALENSNIKRVHDVTFVIINGLIVIAFLGLCVKKYISVFGGTNEPTESLIESDGYSIDDNGVVHNSNTFRHVKSYKKSKITREWVKK